jgi:hypothetical protein
MKNIIRWIQDNTQFTLLVIFFTVMTALMIRAGMQGCRMVYHPFEFRHYTVVCPATK